IIAAQSAYNNGEAWLDQLLTYLEGNIDTAIDYIASRCHGIKAIRPEASFLIWLDCRSLGMSQQQLVDFFIHKAHLALNDGSIFGPEGVGFMRLNVGMPRAKLTTALQQLSKALESL
ncbi:MAG: cystathionine beta-lyase, partial [Muribaculaceae bacterium]|nr:cystathionine beta-lyase [Muribaculaceae bacterium]